VWNVIILEVLKLSKILLTPRYFSFYPNLFIYFCLPVQILSSPWCKADEWNRTEVVLKGIVVTKVREISKILWVICLVYILSFSKFPFSFVLQVMEEGDLANFFFLCRLPFSFLKSLTQRIIASFIIVCACFGFHLSNPATLSHSTAKRKKGLLMNATTCNLSMVVRSVITASSNVYNFKTRQDMKSICWTTSLFTLIGGACVVTWSQELCWL
jgi:hypothetical protein